MTRQRNPIMEMICGTVLWLMLLVPAIADKNPDVGQQGAFGQITALSANSITVQRRGFDARTYTITPGTEIDDNHKPTTVDRLAIGEFAFVTSMDGTMTTAINVNVHESERRRARVGGLIFLAAMVGILVAVDQSQRHHFHDSAPPFPVP